jgi:hypothetical protein
LSRSPDKIGNWVKSKMGEFQPKDSENINERAGTLRPFARIHLCGRKPRGPQDENGGSAPQRLQGFRRSLLINKPRRFVKGVIKAK